jgi:hypothetical protein
MVRGGLQIRFSVASDYKFDAASFTLSSASLQSKLFMAVRIYRFKYLVKSLANLKNQQISTSN